MRSHRWSHEESAVEPELAEPSHPNVEGQPAAQSRRIRFVGAGISLASLGGVILWALRQPAPRLPSSPRELAFLAASIPLYGLALLARAERWHTLLERNDVHSSRADAYSLTAVGYMGNNVLPARGGDLMRIYLLRSRCVSSVRSILGTLVAERILDVLVLLAMFAVVVSSTVGHAGRARERFVAVAIVAVLVALVFAVVLATKRRHLVARLIAFLRPVAAATLNLATFHGLVLLGGTVVIWVFEGATYYAVAQAASLPITAFEAVYIMALTGLLLILPAGPGYAGTFDAGVLVAAKAVGATGSTAVTFLLLLRFVLVVPITIVGLVVLIVRYGGRPQLRPRADPHPT